MAKKPVDDKKLYERKFDDCGFNNPSYKGNYDVADLRYAKEGSISPITSIIAVEKG